MEMVYAFTDEYGAFGWNLDNPSVSTHFIITAIIVKQSKVDDLRKALEDIRKKYFQTGEMKSSSIGKNHSRRAKILSDILKLDFSIFPVVIDKNGCIHMKGLQYKKSFYKFMNNIVHKEIRRGFEKVTIVADEIGTNDYMESFVKYVKERQDIPNLFGEASFLFENSKSDVIIQLADLISGSLAYSYDLHKKSDDTPDYLKMLESKIIRVMQYPKVYSNYVLEKSSLVEGYDDDVANICFRQAAIFLEKNKDSDDKEIIAQTIVLEYLLFRFMNNDKRGYIPTRELINQLQYTIHEKISVSTFRLKIICKLRDAGVIIASSTKGYKIPSKKAELYDFINHGVSIAIPMMERMKKCRDLIKMGTMGEIDLFDHTEYNSLQKYFNDNE